MLRYTIKRFLFIIPMMLGVILLVFSLINLVPGDEVVPVNSDDEDDEGESLALRNKHRCAICNAAMDKIQHWISSRRNDVPTAERV